MFKNKIKRSAVLSLGLNSASALRFLCHFISGVTIWSAYADERECLFIPLRTTPHTWCRDDTHCIGALAVAGVLKPKESIV